MGPYCRFCGQRCFVPFPKFTPRKALRVFAGATIIATCPEGQALDRKFSGGWCLDAINATRSARFWTFMRRGWVKVTLKPGQSLTHRTWERTDEGASWTMTTWEHEGDTVRRKWADGGHDCDGLINRIGENVARMDELTALAVYEPEDPQFEAAARRPRWTEASPTEFHDAYAEAAGY